MKRALFILTISVLLRGAVALAQLCTTADPGYVRQTRPQGVTPNYPPPAEPACYMRTTVSQALPFCTSCHYRQYPSPTVASVLAGYCTGCHPHRSGDFA